MYNICFANFRGGACPARLPLNPPLVNKCRELLIPSAFGSHGGVNKNIFISRRIRFVNGHKNKVLFLPSKHNKVKDQLFLDALHLTVGLSLPYLCMDLSLVCNWWINA